MENLFSYGTLQLESVQLEIFGRKLQGYPDYIAGYKLSFIKIEDEAVITSSGMAEHPMISLTNDPRDIIKGTLFTITATELHHADEYEGEDYKRINVQLGSGKPAWVFVDPK